MVYRSSRRQASREREPDSFELQSEISETEIRMQKNAQLRRQVGRWRMTTVCLVVLSIALAIALAVVASRGATSESSLPTCGEPTTGSDSVSSKRSQIDMSEPNNPGPFHDLTREEIQELRAFLEKDPKIRADKAEDITISSSSIYMMDLFLPKKSEVLKFLDRKGKQPERQAIVMMYRGDLSPPMVEEYICGPLPKVSKCSLLQSPVRRNPLEFSLRPVSITEFDAVSQSLFPKIDKEIGYILKESYGATFSTNCKTSTCFMMYPSPIATNLVDDINKRLLWIWADYPMEYYVLHPVNFGILLDISGSDPSAFKATNIWYNSQFFDSTDELIAKYNSSTIKKVKMTPPKNDRKLFSSMNRRGDPLPKTPQRPPTLVEPDGKRYTLKDRRVDYLGWTFNFRTSAMTGPAIFDVRYKNERIAYEIGLAEIAVFYSADNPMHRTTDYVDSGALIGTHSKSLVPGGDCPESATFINQSFASQVLSQASEINRAFCLFENNNGYPLRRHLSYSNVEGAFYNGMLDSVLVLRSAITVVNYDYILDFIFHQNGVVETRVMSTGYTFPSFYRPEEAPYGFRYGRNIVGNIHHHIFHFKADIDISGTSNRYETLDIKQKTVKLRVKPKKEYVQNQYEHNLKKSEKEALYKYDFDSPKYHVVFNNASRTKYGEIKAFRIGLDGMSKQLLPEDRGSERTIAWARYQLAVTKHKDEEFVSSSPYAMWDSFNPVTDFTKFFEDDENIVDQDLVFWITQGMHHIPHTEDLPVTPTVGNHLTFFLFPYNYFDECPSMASRDQIRIEHKDPSDPSQGVRIDRSGNKDVQCVVPQVATAYDQLLEDDPDVAIESRKFRGIF